MKKKILSSVKAWMDLQNIMLSGLSHSEKDKYHMISDSSMFFDVWLISSVLNPNSQPNARASVVKLGYRFV